MNKKNFYLFLACNIVFLILQAALVLSAHKNVINLFSMSLKIDIEIILTGFFHILLYILLSAVQTFLLTTQKQNRIQTETSIIIIWGCTALVILSANALYFPFSVCGNLMNTLMSPLILTLLLFLNLSILSFLLIRSLAIFLKPHFRKMILFFMFMLFPFVIYHYQETKPIALDQEKPNIIIIGVDSLPVDLITPHNMPGLNQLINNSVHFTNTISPLAKTHPAWMSILTGLYPVHHGAVENLVPENQVKNESSIAWQLQKKGYQTWFATDEKRFSNIGYAQGFQEISGPKHGVNDFFMGRFNDFPLSNLFMNKALSGWFFPYNYLNRASFFSYYPESFDQKLQKLLDNYNSGNPLFLSVHFTLPHWPYVYAKTKAGQKTEQNIDLEYHKQATRAVDKQVLHLVDTLEQRGILKNSLLILLSDHGETLYTPGSRPLFPEKYQGNTFLFQHYLKHDYLMDLDKSMGHGSDLLSPNQFQTLFAVQLKQNGRSIHTPGKIAERVALIDIAPTIQNFLHTETCSTDIDGISLLPQILNLKHPLQSRPFFLESGILPNAAFSLQTLAETVHNLYAIERGFLNLRMDKIEDIKAQKLYGIIQDDWLLALYPSKNQYLPVIYQFSTGFWSDAPESLFIKSTPFLKLHQQMQAFYKTSFPLVTANQSSKSQL